MEPHERTPSWGIVGVVGITKAFRHALRSQYQWYGERLDAVAFVFIYCRDPIAELF